MRLRHGSERLQLCLEQGLVDLALVDRNALLDADANDFAPIDAQLRNFVGGDGTPLVLVHGLGGGASNWVELAPALARRYRVLVPDLPGHGGSAPFPAAPTLSPFADVLAALAEQEGMVPAAVVGHSLGG